MVRREQRPITQAEDTPSATRGSTRRASPSPARHPHQAAPFSRYRSRGKLPADHYAAIEKALRLCFHVDGDLGAVSTSPCRRGGSHDAACLSGRPLQQRPGAWCLPPRPTRLACRRLKTLPRSRSLSRSTARPTRPATTTSKVPLLTVGPLHSQPLGTGSGGTTSAAASPCRRASSTRTAEHATTKKMALTRPPCPWSHERPLSSLQGARRLCRRTCFSRAGWRAGRPAASAWKGTHFPYVGLSQIDRECISK